MVNGRGERVQPAGGAVRLTLMLRFAPLGLLLLPAACTSAVEEARNAPPSPAVRPGPPGQAPVALALRRFHESVYSRFSSGIGEELRTVVRGQQQWEALWARVVEPQGNRPPPPEVDFAREMVLVAAMGVRASGGYSVTIARAIDTPDAIEAHVRHVSPGPRCAATAALTEPVDVAVVRASPKPVRWIVSNEATNCG